MDHKFFSLFDMAIVGIPTIVISVWQLVSVNREIAKDRARKSSTDDPPDDLPDRARHPVGQHRLDDRRPEPAERQAFVERLDILAE